MEATTNNNKVEVVAVLCRRRYSIRVRIKTNHNKERVKDWNWDLQKIGIHSNSIYCRSIAF
jgi:hypothetical protein